MTSPNKEEKLLFSPGWCLPQICERTENRHGAILLILRECSGLTLGGDDIEDGVPDREQVDCEREKVEEGEKQERDKHEETTHARSSI